MTVVQDEELLDAALEQFLYLGLRRTTTEDIAKAAGVNRATIYRRLGDKDAIIRAALLRELQRFIDQIRAYVADFDVFEERAASGFAHTVIGIREHPLVRRMLAVREFDALASMTVDSAMIMDVGVAFITEIINDWSQEFGVTLRGETGEAAALMTRLIHSLALFHDAPPRLQTESELREFALSFVIPLITLEQSR